jgi:DNA-binding transcriptional LysR family regulator
MRLFHRTTRTVDPTAQAAAFLPVVERLLTELDRSIADLRLVAERKKGFVVAAAAASVITFILAPAVSALIRAHPGIGVRVIEDTTENLAKRVLDGEVDFGITTLLYPIDGVDAHLLLQDRLGVIFAKDHKLSKSSAPVAWSEIARLPWISLPMGAGIRGLVDRHPKMAAMVQHPTYEVSNVAALQSLVASNAGVALVPALTGRLAAQGGVAFRPLGGPAIMRELYFVRARQRDMSPAASDLAERVLLQIGALRKDRNIRTNSRLTAAGLAGLWVNPIPSVKPLRRSDKNGLET